MDGTTARALAGGVAGSRAVLGVVAFAAPTLPARLWVGAWADGDTVRVLGRALGARDLALGLGALLALRRDAPVRGWVEAGALADAGDLVATLISFRRLPRLGRWAILAVTAGAVVTARAAAPHLD